MTEEHIDDTGADVAEGNALLLTSYLDEVEDKVQSLRRQVSSLCQEKESLLTVLSQLRSEAESKKTPIKEGDRQDLLMHISRLEEQCQGVSMEVLVIRSPEQEVSFGKVDELVKQLEHECLFGHPSGDRYRKIAQTYLSACVSDTNKVANIDYKFQGMILDCKLEDQKQIRHRLECLVKGLCHMKVLDGNSAQQSLVSNGEAAKSNVGGPSGKTQA